MPKISPCLWFDNNADEAVKFYTSIFKNSKVGGATYYGDAGAKVSGRAKGSVMTIIFELDGQEFMALNGGPQFTFTPAISFFVSCKTEDEIDGLYHKLSERGLVLMELAKYPFSEKFAWVNDRFGISWQLSIASRAQKITPALMFVVEQHGKAEEAMNFYVSNFSNSNVVNVERYGPGEGELRGTVKHAIFSLDGQDFMVMDSGREHPFTFSLATSFIVYCQTQDEIDKFWNDLSAGGNISHCGWLMDKYGVSWQIVPTVLGEMMMNSDPKKPERVMEAVLTMTKLDIAGLKQAYDR